MSLVCSCQKARVPRVLSIVVRLTRISLKIYIRFLPILSGFSHPRFFPFDFKIYSLRVYKQLEKVCNLQQNWLPRLANNYSIMVLFLTHQLWLLIVITILKRQINNNYIYRFFKNTLGLFLAYTWFCSPAVWFFYRYTWTFLIFLERD